MQLQRHEAAKSWSDKILATAWSCCSIPEESNAPFLVMYPISSKAPAALAGFGHIIIDPRPRQTDGPPLILCCRRPSSQMAAWGRMSKEVMDAMKRDHKFRTAQVILRWIPAPNAMLTSGKMKKYPEQASAVGEPPIAHLLCQTCKLHTCPDSVLLGSMAITALPSTVDRVESMVRLTLTQSRAPSGVSR